MNLPPNYPWTEEQATALWQSAKHWLDNGENNERAKIFSDSCPCCTAFLDRTKNEYEEKEEPLGECAACPVAQHSGYPLCERTPREKVMRSAGYNSGSYVYACVSQSACAAEYTFLVQLALGELGPKAE